MGSLREGTIVTADKNQYRIIRELDSGMQAKVYVAMDLNRNKRVAIKILTSNDQGSYERAERESRILSKVLPNNVIFKVDSGKYDDNGVIRFFSVMSYVKDGVTLEHILGREKAIKPLSRALNLLLQIANGLKECHSCGIVHRDIKPGNILVGKDDRDFETAYITDFGIGTVGEDLAEAYERKLTLDEYTLGTPAYIAPQQLIGAGSDPEKERMRKDPRNDVYSYGIVAFEILVGRSPFPDISSTGVLKFMYHKHTGEIVPEKLSKYGTDLPADLVLLVDRCLSYELEDRPQIAEVLAILNVIKLELPSGSASVAPPRPATQRIRTPGSTRVNGDDETMFARSTPPGARKSDPKVVAVKPIGAIPWSRKWLMLAPFVLACVLAGVLLFWDKLDEKRTDIVVGPMSFGSAIAMPASASATTPASAAVVASASASAKPSGQSLRAEPKAKPRRQGTPRVDWSPPATGEQPLDPGLPGPPM